MKKLQHYRGKMNWSQTRLAEMSGVSQTYISELEAGKKQPTIPIVKKLAKALGITYIELLDDSSEYETAL